MKNTLIVTCAIIALALSLATMSCSPGRQQTPNMMKVAELKGRFMATDMSGKSVPRAEVSERPAPRRFETTRPQVLCGEYLVASDRGFWSRLKPQEDVVDMPARKVLGYRARTDGSGKFVFIPVYEDEQEEIDLSMSQYRDR